MGLRADKPWRDSKAQALCMTHAAKHVTFRLSLPPNQSTRREAKALRRPVSSLEIRFGSLLPLFSFLFPMQMSLWSMGINQ